MAKRSKRMRKIEELVGAPRVYRLVEAIDLLKRCPPTRFDQSVTVSLRLGIDPKKSDQQVRGTVLLPHGTGRSVKVVVIAKGDKVKEALAAGADFVGSDDIMAKIQEGWTAFDVLIAVPEMMRDLGKLAKILGPRGLMPTPKAGTVTQDVGRAVLESKKGKVEFKADKAANVNVPVGKISFDMNSLEENVKVLVQAVSRWKPATAKGVFLRALHLGLTMGPGLRVDLQSCG
jgi:large subunit ribosomal protein L1